VFIGNDYTILVLLFYCTSRIRAMSIQNESDHTQLGELRQTVADLSNVGVPSKNKLPRTHFRMYCCIEQITPSTEIEYKLEVFIGNDYTILVLLFYCTSRIRAMSIQNESDHTQLGELRQTVADLSTKMQVLNETIRKGLSSDW
jgi:CRISPR/Cas system CSM-associated protein Csm5 (group 7 of RAMP superfamily)